MVPINNKRLICFSKIMIYRNFNDIVFNTNDNYENANICRERVSKILVHYVYEIKTLKEMEKDDLFKLYVKGVITADILKSPNNSVLFNKDDIYILINADEHICATCISHGMTLKHMKNKLKLILDKISEKHPFAKNENGFINSKESRCGTGAKTSLYLHLPILLVQDQIDNFIKKYNNIKISRLKVLPSHSLEGVFEVTNNNCKYFNDDIQIYEIYKISNKILLSEIKTRENFIKDRFFIIKDKVNKAFGILNNAIIISQTDIMVLYSYFRLAAEFNLINNSEKIIDEIFYLIFITNLKKDEDINKDRIRAKQLKRCLALIN